ncbi:AraC family transcriptional regulator [Aquicoccus porphyridii]|uniref:AraC family transcriptional regulator n=1 Tax=Aquicoccus porphyridii TaxID=1852029 RepID=A0A5A9ZD03_9RHOB|nr:AraC family transcriptional regulator [Aquicoccus porphyridii]KAA0914875.1 AraC family transcriptional regulator [Aquicoccus porphyridii]RAI52579.1 AraC family transcriptional regulator [Rhodobacteraceae bacterium AsT-22]
MRQLPPDKFKVQRVFWRGLETIGLPPAQVLRLARLPATLHLDPNSQVTTAQYFALLRAAEELCGDPASGFKTVAQGDPSLLPPSLLIANYARNYRDGLARTARFKPLFAPERLHVSEDGGDWSLWAEWHHAPDQEPPLVADITFAALLELGRRNTRVRIVPRRVELSRPDDGGGAHEHYYGCPVPFGAARNILVLKAEDLDRPFRGHNPEMLEILGPALSEALAELTAQGSVSAQVKAVMKKMLPSGRPELREVARELGVGERTLQRRIAEEGGNLRQLLTEARRDLGRQLLLEPSMEIGEVAILLGFEDSNSFYRAFRSWEGTTPARWRELQA